MDARSGDTMLSKHPDSRRPIASTTKLMTALLVLESGKLGETFTAPAYTTRCLPSRRSTCAAASGCRGRDLLYGIAAGERQTTRPWTSRRECGRLAPGVRGPDEPAGSPARPAQTRTTANPIGLDATRELLERPRIWPTLARRLMADPTFAAIVDRPAATLHSGDHLRTIRKPQPADRPLPLRRRRQDGPYDHRRLRAGRGGARQRRQGGQRGARGAERERPRRGHAGRCCAGGSTSTGAFTVLLPGKTVAYATVAYHDHLRIPLTTRRGASFTLRRGERLTTRVHAPQQLDGPIAADRRVGSVDVLYLGRRVKTLGLVTARAVPGSTFIARVMDPLGPVLHLASLGPCGTRGGASGSQVAHCPRAWST